MRFAAVKTKREAIYKLRRRREIDTEMSALSCMNSISSARYNAVAHHRCPLVPGSKPDTFGASTAPCSDLSTPSPKSTVAKTQALPG